MIRLIGAGLVILATSYTGFRYSGSVAGRIHQMREIQGIFTDLYSDVEYGACTLAESFSRIARRQNVMFQGFLICLCECMGQVNGMDFAAIFEETVELKLKDSDLKKEDKDELIYMGKQLGNQPRQGQLRAVELYLHDLERKIQELERDKQDRQKLSRVLGIAGGVLIVILLL
jgi:stage III sporulation protein AB